MPRPLMHNVVYARVRTTGARVISLENRRARKSLVSSNLTLSATKSWGFAKRSPSSHYGVGSVGMPAITVANGLMIVTPLF